jgi:hypothetical protein
MARFAHVMLDGVTYVAARHEPVVQLVAVDDGTPPSATVAEDALRATLAQLGGIEARLRAGFAAVRLVDQDRASGAWVGPAHLFSFEAPVAGAFDVPYAGEDGSDWPAPSFDVGVG